MYVQRFSLNIFSRVGTGFQGQAKLFDLRFILEKTFLQIVIPGRPNHPGSQPVNLLGSQLLMSPPGYCVVADQLIRGVF